MKTILEKVSEYLIKKQKERKKEDNFLQIKYDSLSLSDKYAYEQMIKERETNFTPLFIYAVPIAVFYLIIIALVFKFWFGIDAIETFRGITHSLLKLWLPLIFIGLFADLISIWHTSKFKRRLLIGR